MRELANVGSASLLIDSQPNDTALYYTVLLLSLSINGTNALTRWYVIRKAMQLKKVTITRLCLAGIGAQGWWSLATTVTPIRTTTATAETTCLSSFCCCWCSFHCCSCCWCSCWRCRYRHQRHQNYVVNAAQMDSWLTCLPLGYRLDELNYRLEEIVGQYKLLFLWRFQSKTVESVVFT